MWNKTKLTKETGIEYPLIQAPMAGGPTSPELVSAVSNAGGLGSLGAGYMDPGELEEKIIQIRKLTDNPFAVNLFVPSEYEYDTQKVKKILEAMTPYFQELKLSPDSDVEPLKDYYRDHIEVIVKNEVPVVSFTFGVPDSSSIRRLRSKDIILLGTSTTVEEAIDLESKGLDVIVAQGYEAGGHRGSYLGDSTESLIGTFSLIPQVVDNVSRPVVASGGIMDGRGIAGAICLGASGVQMGTAFLTCTESGAQEIHKNSVLTSREVDTVLTKMFSGKLARGIRNRFTTEMEKFASVVPDYPVQNSLTRGIRKESANKRNPELMSLWSGQGVRLSRSLSAQQLVNTLIDEVNQVFNSIK